MSGAIAFDAACCNALQHTCRRLYVRQSPDVASSMSTLSNPGMFGISEQQQKLLDIAFSTGSPAIHGTLIV